MDKPEDILEFKLEYRWLSNFWPCPIHYQGIDYPSVEHAYQAAKTLDQPTREKISKLPSPGQAKSVGRHLDLRSDWEQIKWDTMFALVWQKFQCHEDLKAKLLATGSARLVEGNTWGDVYWGVCRGKGENQLGEILMLVREILRA